MSSIISQEVIWYHFGIDTTRPYYNKGCRHWLTESMNLHAFVAAPYWNVWNVVWKFQSIFRWPDSHRPYVLFPIHCYFLLHSADWLTAFPWLAIQGLTNFSECCVPGGVNVCWYIGYAGFHIHVCLACRHGIALSKLLPSTSHAWPVCAGVKFWSLLR